MQRLGRKTGMLAALGVAIGALLVAPVSTTPAQADHIDTWDNAHWRFNQAGSWWRAYSDNCFTTNWEYLERVSITNNGSQAHYFQWKWMDYYGHVKKFSPLQYVRPGETWALDAPSSGWGAIHQAYHPRVKIYWENSAGEIVLLWDLHPWSSSAYDSAGFMGSSELRGC